VKRLTISACYFDNVFENKKTETLKKRKT